MPNPKTFRPEESHKLEDPERLNWLPPAEVLAKLPLRESAHVADIGAGTGYFAVPLAREVSRVFAVDLQPEMLDKLREKLRAPGAPHNIEPVQGDAAKTGLPDHCCDVALFANIWHELENQPAALHEARRILRERGTLAILDWRNDVDRPPGPPLDHRIAMEEVVHTLEHNGWTVHYFGHAGRYNYLLVAGPSDESVQS